MQTKKQSCKEFGFNLYSYYVFQEICPEIPIVPEGEAGRYYQSLRRHQGNVAPTTPGGGAEGEGSMGERRPMSFFAAEHARRESLGLYDSRHNLRRRGSVSTEHKVIYMQLMLFACS